MNLLEYEATNHEAVRSYQLWYNYAAFYTTKLASVIALARPQRYCFYICQKNPVSGRENLKPNDMVFFLLILGHLLETADRQKLMLSFSPTNWYLWFGSQILHQLFTAAKCLKYELKRRRNKYVYGFSAKWSADVHKEGIASYPPFPVFVGNNQLEGTSKRICFSA